MFKVGQKVWCAIYGAGVVEEILHTSEGVYPVVVRCKGTPAGAEEPFCWHWENTFTGGTGTVKKNPETLGINMSHPDYKWTALYTAPHTSPTAQVADSVLEDAARSERERICAAIKVEDDYCVEQGDYMLDSDDCIKIARGDWVRPDFSVDAARRKQGEAQQ